MSQTQPVPKTRAKPNSRRPPPGWEVYPVWVARGSILTAERIVQEGCAGDGELLDTRSEAVKLAWDEYEAVQEHLQEKADD